MEERQDRIAYIGEMTSNLAKIARADDQPALALLLEMAALEADLASEKWVNEQRH